MHPIVSRHRKEIDRLCAQFHVRRLNLFGSAARGEDKPGKSDFDFLVELEPMAPREYKDAYFGLLFALERLLGRPIDLVTLPSIRNPLFLESITPDLTAVYGENSSHAAR